MVKFGKFAILLLCALTLTGCGSQVREPDELEMIRVIGIDAAEDGVTVTICTGPPAEGGKPTVRMVGGLTIDGALKTLQSASPDRIPFYSHTKYVVVDEDLARRGLGETLDYISRSSEMRIGTGVVIAKGSAAELITETAGETGSAFTNLTNIEEKSPAAGTGAMFTALDASTALLRRNCAAVLTVELTGEEEKSIIPAGFGVIIDNKLVGQLPESDSLGALILTGKADNVTVSAEIDGKPAAFTLSGFNVEKDHNIVVKAEAFLNEIGGRFDPTDETQRRTAEQTVAAILTDSITGAVNDAQLLGADLFGVGSNPKITVSVTLTGSYDTDRGIFGEK